MFLMTGIAIGGGAAGAAALLYKFFSSEKSEEELNLRRNLLTDAMDDLNDREKDIITWRQLSDEPKTLEELSQIFKISRERVRQIEVKAFDKLRKKIKNMIDK
mgnify:CR=1 FL=1